MAQAILALGFSRIVFLLLAPASKFNMSVRLLCRLHRTGALLRPLRGNQKRTVATEPDAKKVKTGLVKETVFYETFDGATAEFCPYTKTSKNYDGVRAPLGL